MAFTSILMFAMVVLCERCREAGCVKISVESMKILSYLLAGSWHYLMAVPDDAVDEVCSVVIAYTQWHLECFLKAFFIFKVCLI